MGLSLLALLAACSDDTLPSGELRASAAPTELFFSEYVEGSSNNKALEIYNGTGQEVDLSVGKYNVQIYFNGGSSAGLTANLTGSVATGDVFVLAQSSANATILAQADQTNGSGWFNGDDAVVLRKGGAVLDVIGQVGTDPGSELGSGLTSTADNTLRRQVSMCSGNADGSDAFDPLNEWDGFATDSFDDLGSHMADCGGPVVDVAPTVSSTTPADGATGVALNSNVVVNFSEPVTVDDAGVALVCGGESAEFVLTPSEHSSTYTLDPIQNFSRADECVLTIAASAVTDQDGTPDTMADDYSLSFTVLGAVTKIHEVQGSTDVSPLAGQTVTVEGIVMGDFEGPSPALRGFYVQEEKADWDEEATTSEGIFVFNGDADNVSVGETVNVTGRVSEFGGQTQITASATEILDSGANVEPTDITLPFPEPGNRVPYLERFEGMFVNFSEELVISEYFNFERFGEIVLAEPLEKLERPYQPTSYVNPGDAAAEIAEANARSRITLDDGRMEQNPDPARHPNGEAFTLENRFRGGDTVQNTTGVLDYRFGSYRVQPTQGADYTVKNPRTDAPEDVGGSLTVASFNVLNLFNGDGQGGGFPTSLGADDVNEYERQLAKIVAALAAIDADVFGLIEIENDPAGENSSLNDLVDALNEVGAGSYDYIETGTLGSDAIKVAFIYKPATVTPVGDYAVLDASVDARFDTTRNRPALAQTFRDGAGGVFTAVVNHLKSKGSGCGAGDDDPQQGNCNGTRTRAAEALVDWLGTDPTGSGDPDVLIVGDLNAYDEEAPIDVLKEGDYTDLVEEFEGEFAYSYLFGAQFGHLDYALANGPLLRQVTGATDWHINADEPDLLDYDTGFKKDAQDALYEPNPYRSSDHDPVVVGLDLEVPDPRELLADLIDEVEVLGLGRGDARALLAQLETAQRQLGRGQERQAEASLERFEAGVARLVNRGVLSAEQGQAFTEDAQAIRDLI